MKKVMMASLVAAMAVVVSGCAGTPPEQTAAQVKQGLTQDQVIVRLGPPDRFMGPIYAQCFEYRLGKTGQYPYSVYFNRDKRAVFANNANCSVDMAKRVGIR
jgi:hypothetical protein